MEKKLCVIGYIPPSKFKGSPAFLENITKFKTTYPLLLCSDENYPNTIRLKMSPEVVKGSKYPNGRDNPWSTNNLVFFTCLSIARQQGYSHLLYVEADVRVGIDNWDSVIFNEAFADGDPLLSGTIWTHVVASTKSIAFNRAWNKFIQKNADKKFPVVSFGGMGVTDAAVFPNGALGVYDVDWLCQKFDLSSCPVLAAKRPAWDFSIGVELVKEFGVEAFNHVKHLDSIYSGFGDVSTSEMERAELLTSGQVVAAHQFKSDWPGPERIEEKPAPVIVKVEVKPRVGILIVSYLKDLDWLDYCLTSIDRFATGFDQVTIAVPKEGSAPFKKLAKAYDTALYLFEETKGKGHLCQNAMKCSADIIMPDMDFILHMDSDCVFKEPVTPDDYFVDGKPVLLYKPYDCIPEIEGTTSPRVWREPTERALGFPVEHEFMQRHPSVHPKLTTFGTRQMVEKTQNEPFLSYVLRQKSTFPYGFSEFNTIGAYAFYHMHNAYHWIDTSKEERPHNKLVQFWSHGGLDKAVEMPTEGVEIGIVPRHWMDKLLEKYSIT